MSYRVLLFLLSALLVSCSGADPDRPGSNFSVEEVALEVPEGAAAYVPQLEGPLRILSATPGGTMFSMGPEQTVAVTFSQPMVVLGAAPAAAPGTLTLDPAVPGTLRWDGTQTLVFQPEAPLPLATAFRATLAAGLTALSGERIAEPFSWSFTTPLPALVASTPADGARFVEPRPTFDLRFNQPLRVDRADRFILLRRSDAPSERIPVAVRRGASDSVLVVEPARALRQGTSYELVLQPGLPSARGLGAEQEQVVRFTTYDELKLLRVDQPRSYWEEEDERFDPERGVTLFFSTPVRFGDLRNALSFSPAVAFPPGIEARDEAMSTEHALMLDLAPEQTYTITLRNLTDQFGQQLGHATYRFKTRPYKPQARMHAGLLVIEADEQAVVPIRATNIEAVQLGAVRLRADEVVPALRTYDGGRYYGQRGAEGPAPVPADRRFSLGLARNKPGTVPLRLDSLLAGRTGLVALRMVVPKQGREEERDYRALAQVTRLGLTAKFSPHQNLVLVTDLKTARPVENAAVTIRDGDNRVRWQGRTDRQGRALSPGWAALGIVQPDPWNQPVQFAFAEAEGDVAFTSSAYNEGIEPYRFNVHYDWSPEARTEAGSVFSDRGLYRAGDTVYLKGILRQKTDGDWQPITDSIRVLIRSPRDAVVFDQGYRASGLGTFDLSWTAPPGADQGVYTVRIVHADDSLAARREPYEEGDIAQSFFRVDAFRTATFAVTAQAAAPAYVAGDFFEGSVEGRYLFGASMAGQTVRYSLRREHGYYAPPGYEGYRFGGFSSYRDGGGIYRTLLQADTVLDEGGLVRARTQLPGNEQGAAATLVWSGSVEDPARQEGADRTEITLHPGLFYIGLKPRTTFLDLTRGKTMAVDVMTVDPNGRPVGGREVKVELVRAQWNSVREVGADGRLRWRSEYVEEPLGSQQVRPAAGKASRLSMDVPQGGSYRIRAEARDLRGNTIRSEAYFYATGAGYVAWQRSDDDRIELVPEKTTYRPGETARIMVQSPYETATALVTVEREGILSSEVVTLEGSAPQITVPLGEKHLPNAFVSVILLSGRTARPGPGSDTGAPGFKIGYASLRVDPGVRHLQVSLEPDRLEYRPGDEVRVKLQLRDADGRGVPGEIAFSAADAGVLNLIGYRLPDPFEVFYGERPLGVATSETRANLIEQRSFGQKEEDMAGGGGDADFLLRKDFRPLAHWAPAVRTDRRGRAEVTFRLPESLTTFRFMAAALTADNRFGAGQTDVVVTQPLVLLPALPRFVRLDDRFEAGVLVTNNSKEAGEATVTARAEGLELGGSGRQTVHLAPGETREVRFPWRVPRVGDTRLTFDAQLGAERDAFALSLPVTLPTTKETWATFAATTGTATEGVRLPEDRVPGLGRFEARLSSTALVGLDGAAEYLFTYPYGCLEQRTSAVRPLLVADDLLDAFGLEVLDGNSSRKAEVEKWLGMLRDFWVGNGFTLWPGASYRNPYVSAYVVLALAEAKAAGFAIPEALTREALDVLDFMVRNRSERPDYYGEAVWADTRALMLYALARHGRILESEVNLLAKAALGDAGALSVDGESYLLRTLVLANRPSLNAFRQPLLERIDRRTRVEATTAYLSAPEQADFYWIFASDTRSTAFGLTALIEADPSTDRQQLAQRMVRYLMQARQGGHWASTQDNAAVIDAFRAFYEAYERQVPDFAAEVRVAGQTILQEQFRGRSLQAAAVSRPLEALPQDADAPVQIEKAGTGPLYYSLRLESYTSAPQPAVRSGISVERRIQRLDERGQPKGEALLTGEQVITLRPGELVRVTLRLSSPAERNYVVVDDALPAGLEALNAAFGTTNQEVLRQAGAGQDRWWGSFNHTEIRNDRVLLFADYLRRGEHTYTYVARATTPGTFVHPPAAAEMMYQPETYGRTATGTLVVE